MNFLANPRHTHRKYFRRKWNKQKHRLFNKLHLKSWSPMMHFAPGSSSPRFISSFPSTSLFPTLSISPLHSSCPWSSVKPQYLLASISSWTQRGLSRAREMPLLSSVQSVQFSSVVQSCLTLCDPMVCSTPGLPVHHQLLEFTQTHVHWVGDAIQPSHPLPSPSPPAFNLSQHQGLFKWVSSLHQVAKGGLSSDSHYGCNNRISPVFFPNPRNTRVSMHNKGSNGSDAQLRDLPSSGFGSAGRPSADTHWAGLLDPPLVSWSLTQIHLGLQPSLSELSPRTLSNLCDPALHLNALLLLLPGEAPCPSHPRGKASLPCLEGTICLLSL